MGAVKMVRVARAVSLVSLVRIACMGVWLCAPLCAGGDIALPQWETHLARRGVTPQYTDQAFQALMVVFDQDMACVMAAAPHATAARFLAYGHGLLQRAASKAAASKDSEEQAYAYMVAKNILYTLETERVPERGMSVTEKIEVPFTRLKTKIPYRTGARRAKVLSEHKAAQEARFLVDPQSPTPRTFIDRPALIGMTHDQVSELDVRDDHHIWYQDSFIRRHPDLWTVFETALIKRVEAYHHIESYPIELARQVVFASTFRGKGGTHGKISVTDPYGLTWKLKWGDELYGDSIATRLYVQLGGKYQNPKYTHTMDNPITLIFPRKPWSDPCLQSFEDLLRCMKQSAYHLDLRPYAQGPRGTLTLAQVQAFAKQFPGSSFSDELYTEAFVGAEYVTLTAASMEIRDVSVAEHGGAIAQSNMGSEDDRAMRGMILMHLFFDNFDAKDSIGTAALGQDLLGQSLYMQAPMDLGASFRGSWFHGVGINHYKERHFLQRGLFNTHHLIYDRLLLYRAMAHEQATYADTLWMAKKIAKLTRKQIEAAVKDAHMPDFFNEVLIYKILKRRNLIASLYEIEDLQEKNQAPLEPPTTIYPLGTDAQRVATARALKVPVGLLSQGGVMPPQDTVVKRGRIQTSDRSFLVRLLEHYVFPDGLAR